MSKGYPSKTSAAALLCKWIKTHLKVASKNLLSSFCNVIRPYSHCHNHYLWWNQTGVVERGSALANQKTGDQMESETRILCLWRKLIVPAKCYFLPQVSECACGLRLALGVPTKVLLFLRRWRSAATQIFPDKLVHLTFWSQNCSACGKLFCTRCSFSSIITVHAKVTIIISYFKVSQLSLFILSSSAGKDWF